MYYPASYLCSRIQFSLLAALFHARFKPAPAELRLGLQFIEGYTEETLGVFFSFSFLDFMIHLGLFEKEKVEWFEEHGYEG